MGWNLQLGMKQKVVGSQNLTLEATISSWKQTSFFSTGHWVELWWSAYQSLWEKTTMDDETWLSTHFFPLQQCPTPVVSVETCLKRSKHIKTRGFFTKWFFLVGYLDCRFFTVFTTFLFSPLDLVEAWQVHCMGRFSTQARNPVQHGAGLGTQKTSQCSHLP